MNENEEARIVAHHTDRIDGALYVFASIEFYECDKWVGTTTVDWFKVDPERPYSVQWNLHSIDSYHTTEQEALARVDEIEAWHGPTHDLWTCDLVQTIYAPDEHTLRIVDRRELVGTRPPNESKWGTTEMRMQESQQHQALLDHIGGRDAT